eukprot:16167945-Heterocapsa_arctica.AAC.1
MRLRRRCASTRGRARRRTSCGRTRRRCCAKSSWPATRGAGGATCSDKCVPVYGLVRGQLDAVEPGTEKAKRGEEALLFQMSCCRICGDLAAALGSTVEDQEGPQAWLVDAMVRASNDPE